MTMKIRRCLILVALPLSVGACDNKGSLGEYMDGTGGQGATGTSGDGGDGDDGGDTHGASEGGTGGDTAGQTAGTTAGETGGGTTAGPLGCDGGGCAIECGVGGCGPLDHFDAEGCQRPSCSDDDQCGAQERCYVGELFGQCVSSGLFCDYDDELAMCICGGSEDCGGGYCVDADVYPEGNAGPDGPARLDNGCAPDDGPAIDIRIGLVDGSCESVFGAEPNLRFSLHDAEFGETGTYEIGIQHSGTVGQGWYQDGDETHPVWIGTVTISQWGLDAGIAGSYEVFAGEQKDTGFGHYVGTFDGAQFCDSNPGCG